MRTVKVIFSLSVFLFFIACSVKLSPNLEVPKVPPVERKATGFFPPPNTEISISTIRDRRVNAEIAILEDKKSLPIGDIVGNVKESLETSLKSQGYVISGSAPLVVEGEVRDWYATIDRGVPARVKSRAALYLEVFDPANKRMYSGSYEGQASLEENSVNDKDIKAILGISMTEAIKQVVNDQRLLNILASY